MVRCVSSVLWLYDDLSQICTKTRARVQHIQLPGTLPTPSLIPSPPPKKTNGPVPTNRRRNSPLNWTSGHSVFRDCGCRAWSATTNWSGSRCSHKRWKGKKECCVWCCTTLLMKKMRTKASKIPTLRMRTRPTTVSIPVGCTPKPQIPRLNTRKSCCLIRMGHQSPTFINGL